MRRRLPLLVGVGVVLVAVVAWAAYWLGFTHQNRDVAVPQDDASAEAVVGAFIAALDAGDCAAARQLVQLPDANDTPASWCEDVASLGEFQVRPASREKPQWSGHARGQQVVRVGVTFDLDWRWLRNDGSMQEGPTTWGYLLVRDAEDEPWRIFDQGVS